MYSKESVVLNKLKKYELTKIWLNKNQEIFNQPKHISYEIIAKKVFEIMDISSFGIWKLNLNRTLIQEDITFHKTGVTTRKRELTKAAFPKYFDMLLKESVIVLNTHELEKGPLSSLYENYLIPNQVESLLDAPIYIDGNLYGVLCFESKGKVEWDLVDQFFIQVCADFIGRITELMKRKSFERTLGYRVLKLEEALGRKLQEIDMANESFDYALEGAAVARWTWIPNEPEYIVNDNWYKLMGYDPQEFAPNLENFQKILHPDDLLHFDDLVLSMERKEKVLEFRHRLKCKNGNYQWFLDRAKLTIKDGSTYYHGFKVNISPIVELENNIKISQKHLESILESLPIPVALIDKNLNYVTYSEKWVDEWTSSIAPEIKVGGPCIVPEQPRYEEMVETLNSVLNGEVFNVDETLADLGPHRKLWLRWSAQPWRLLNGEIAGIILVVENINEKKVAQINLNQASKLTALGEMASGIAHEVNNPLGIIKGYIDLLKRQIQKKSLSQESLIASLDKIDITIGRISSIVSGMRKFSRESINDEKVPYSLDLIIKETFDICREKFSNHGVKLEIDTHTNPAIVFCRPVEISQVILNLLTNSFHAISHQQYPWINITFRDTDSDYIIDIIDSGEGISTNVAENMFNPFFTTKEVGVGTGLGLSISKGIIEEHFGTLQYDSSKLNTCFTVKLPKMSKVDN